jgi:hypothetical protein
MATNYYTTEGNIRGACGHKHRTLDTALACIAKDNEGCVSQGGYSDRQVVEMPAKRRITSFYEIYIYEDTGELV